MGRIFIELKPDVNERMFYCRNYLADKYRLKLRDNELVVLLLNNFWQMEKIRCQDAKKEKVEDCGLF